MTQARTFTALLLALLATTPAIAADMIDSGPYSTPQGYGTQTVGSVCDVLKIDYRDPNTPRTELAKVCYQPVDLSPAGKFDPGGGAYGRR